jgi:hypothetical protein
VRDLPLSPEERQRYAGSYTISAPDGGRLVVRIYEEGGVLKGQPEGDEPSRLLYQGDHTFRPELNPAMVVVFTVADNRATRFVLYNQGMTMEGVRNP